MSAYPAPRWRWERGSAHGKKWKFPGYLADTVVVWAFWVPISGPEALVRMRCHRAKDSTWASGVGSNPRCRAPWLYVSFFCRPVLKPVDKESEVIIR